MAEARWEEIARSTRAAIEAGTFSPGQRLPSEAELAAQWSVCRMTAHRAMDELHRLGLVERRRRAGTTVAENPPATRAVIPHVGYHGDHRQTFPKKIRQIALLLFHVNDYPQIGYLHGFQSGVAENDRLLLCDTRNSGEREARVLEQVALEADAICCYPTGDPESSSLLTRIAGSGIPVVLIDRFPDGVEGVDVVMTDNLASSHSALQSLRTRGHEKIAFITTENDRVSSVRERKAAFGSFMTESGASLSETAALIRSFPRGTGYDVAGFGQGVFDALYTLLHQPNPPTAIFCLEDYFLWAVLGACDRMGLRVPQDLEILSFSDCPPMVPRLSQNVHRVVQATFEMGQIATELIYRRLSGEVIEPSVTLLPAVLHPASVTYQSLSDRSHIP